MKFTVFKKLAKIRVCNINQDLSSKSVGCFSFCKSASRLANLVRYRNTELSVKEHLKECCLTEQGNKILSQPFPAFKKYGKERPKLDNYYWTRRKAGALNRADYNRLQQCLQNIITSRKNGTCII